MCSETETGHRQIDTSFTGGSPRKVIRPIERVAALAITCRDSGVHKTLPPPIRATNQSVSHGHHPQDTRRHFKQPSRRPATSKQAYKPLTSALFRLLHD